MAPGPWGKTVGCVSVTWSRKKKAYIRKWVIHPAVVRLVMTDSDSYQTYENQMKKRGTETVTCKLCLSERGSGQMVACRIEDPKNYVTHICERGGWVAAAVEALCTGEGLLLVS
jgi:hypothetical protein